MIQRIQSLFLLLASGSAFSLFADPLTFVEVDSTGQLPATSSLADGMFNIHDNIIMMILVVLSGLLALGAIFLFDNRRQQMTATRLVLILGVLMVVLSGILFYMDFDALAAGTEVVIGFGVIPPVLVLFFAALALRFIGKDEKLVRSMDRLR